MSDEDSVVNDMIKYYQNKWNEWRGEFMHFWGDDCSTHVESHYNNFGTRGVVDLYVSQPDIEYREPGDDEDVWRLSDSVVGAYTDHIYEVKADAAVQNATGANEILRQFNKMRSTFFEGSNYNPSGPTKYHLTFYPSESTLENLVENTQMYESAVESAPSGESQTASQVELWHPDDSGPCRVFPSPPSQLMDEFHEKLPQTVVDEHHVLLRNLASQVETL